MLGFAPILGVTTATIVVLAETGGDAAVYGIPVASIVAAVAMLFKTLWTELQNRQATIDRLNEAALERAERTTTVVSEATQVMREAVSALAERRPQLRRGDGGG